MSFDRAGVDHPSCDADAPRLSQPLSTYLMVPALTPRLPNPRPKSQTHSTMRYPLARPKCEMEEVSSRPCPYFCTPSPPASSLILRCVPHPVSAPHPLVSTPIPTPFARCVNPPSLCSDCSATTPHEPTPRARVCVSMLHRSPQTRAEGLLSLACRYLY